MQLLLKRWEIMQGRQSGGHKTAYRHRRIERIEEQLQLADVRLDAQQPRLVRVQPQVQHHRLRRLHMSRICRH